MLGPNELSEYMRRKNIVGEIIWLSRDEARTSTSAARAVGCDVSQIAKNIVIKGGDELYLIIISGDKKIDYEKASKKIGHKVSLAKPEEVLEILGYPVGGVPPFGHKTEIKTYIDTSILRFEEVYTSGGSEDTLMKIKTSELLKVVGEDNVGEFSR